MQKSLLLIAALWCSLFAFAQEEPVEDDPVKKLDHFAGVQANPLLRQIISLGNVPEVENPFLFQYTVRFNSSNLAISAGVGHSQQKSENDDGLETSSSSLSGRLGIGQQFRISERFELGYSLDFIANRESTESFTLQVTDFGTGKDSTFSNTKTIEEGYGAGIRINLSFYISQRILIGTEAGYNYIRSSKKFHLFLENHLIQEDLPPTIFTDVINEEEDIVEYSAHLPMTIFLILKF